MLFVCPNCGRLGENCSTTDGGFSDWIGALDGNSSPIPKRNVSSQMDLTEGQIVFDTSAAPATKR
jgi:hypothetical protein